ncbi:putative zinc finger-containing protein [Lyophyllum shimeji]|uniref:Zinc finger-containing protein n=1 Tax=Lyophyllum shimeji TaxID=47721 RepID=A0A9P3PFQ2_LYOSH|nr:putative zinc finger-containing protein [Lyophyllum shimeji]
MSQQLQYHHHQPQYVHYTGPPGAHIQPQVVNGNAGVAPHSTTHQHQQHQQPSQAVPTTSTSTPLVATGDWTKDLVHLAKTAELKKHALTLQLHTAHILSAHASLQEKSKAIQDIREQRNKLESERTKLLNALREINEDRDKADLMEATIERECHEIRTKMNHLTEGEYAVAKADVDRLRQELGQPPLPSLQSTLDEKSNQYLNERRLSGNDSQNSASAGSKRGSGDLGSPDAPSTGKRPRGRPKGSKNRAKEGTSAAGPSTGVM